MLPPNPADKLNAAPVTDLIELLLKQFRRILADRQIDLASDDMRAIADAAAAHRPLPPLAERVMPALIDAVDESQALLRERFGLSFGDSLAADMQTIGGWETTADFLAIANEKSNAELRITAGASLLMMLGEACFGELLLTAIDHDAGANDVDAAFARRAISHASGIDLAAPDWRAQVTAWLLG